MSIRYLALVCLAGLAFACKEVQKNETQSQAEVPIAIQKQVPTAEYEDLAGNPIALADFKGKRVLLNYWATWCKPCIEEMPVLERLQSELSAEGYVFLFASDQSQQVIKKFKAAKGFDLTFLKFNGTWADEDISALPVTLIYNTAGEQVDRFDGMMAWDSPEMIEKLKALN